MGHKVEPLTLLGCIIVKLLDRAVSFHRKQGEWGPSTDNLIYKEVI